MFGPAHAPVSARRGTGPAANSCPPDQHRATPRRQHAPPKADGRILPPDRGCSGWGKTGLEESPEHTGREERQAVGSRPRATAQQTSPVTLLLSRACAEPPPPPSPPMPPPNGAPSAGSKRRRLRARLMPALDWRRMRATPGEPGGDVRFCDKEAWKAAGKISGQTKKRPGFHPNRLILFWRPQGDLNPC